MAADAGHPGDAHILADDDPYERLRWLRRPVNEAFVLVQEAGGSGRWKVALRTKNRGRITLGSFQVSHGRGSFGRALPVRLDEVTRVSVVEQRGEGRLVGVAHPQK